MWVWSSWMWRALANWVGENDVGVRGVGMRVRGVWMRCIGVGWIAMRRLRRQLVHAMKQLLQLAQLLLERVKVMLGLEHVHAAAAAEEGAAHGARLVLLRLGGADGRVLGGDVVRGHLRCVVYFFVRVMMGLVGEGHADGERQEDEHRPGCHRSLLLALVRTQSCRNDW
jgi:hypothetical protein